MSYLKTLCLCLLTLLSVTVVSWAQVDVPLSAPSVSSATRFANSQKFEAAEQAMRTGLYSLAVRLYEQLRAAHEPGTPLWREVSLRLVKAQISAGKFSSAKATLESLEATSESNYALCMALLAQVENRTNAAATALEVCRVEELSPEEKPWYYMVAGLVAEARNQDAQAFAYFEKGRELAASIAQASRFEMLIYRHRLLNDEVDEALVESLAEKAKDTADHAEGLVYARQYAIALHRIGRSEDALAVIRKQLLRVRAKKSGEEDMLHLLVAWISGVDSLRGREALEGLLRNGRERKWQRVALHMLMQSSESARDDLLELLSDIIRTAESSEEKTHSLLDEIYLMRAQLSFHARKYEDAVSDAHVVIDRYPGSDNRPAALQILASVVIQRDPPQYRTAADYLSQLRDLLPQGSSRGRLSVLIGDCYFLNKDYANASDFYRQALQNPAAHAWFGVALFQQVLADIRAGDLAVAQKHLDAFMLSDRVPPLLVWQAEWNLVDALRQAEQGDAALARIKGLLDRHANAMPDELELRLMWLRAHISLQTPEVAAVPIIADDIVSRLSEKPLDTEQQTLIMSNTLLLKGQAFFRMDREGDALAAFAQLREGYPGTQSSVRSYMDEARHFMAQGKLVEAQQRLIELVDKNRENDLAPVALYEAAITAEQQGLQRTYEEAVGLLQRLIKEYPKSGLTFYARLKQGDILRKQNEFGAARSRYEGLLQAYPNHPRINEVQMALAYTLLAQMQTNDNAFSQAVAMLERLYDLPTIAPELRIEAGFQWAQALTTREQLLRAEEVYWQMLTKYLIEPKQEYSLGVTGRYWLARAVFELAGLMEKQNRIDEALNVYAIIVRYELPGKATAEARKRIFTAPVGEGG